MRSNQTQHGIQGWLVDMDLTFRTIVLCQNHLEASIPNATTHAFEAKCDDL
jgi:RNase P/RNase MRP subunit p29